MPPVTGKTAIVLMLANPVSHIRGTALINDSLAELGLDAVVVPIKVEPEDLARVFDAVRAMGNVVGMGITVPHKIAALTLVDEATIEARRFGATNFVRRDADGRLVGTNIDGAGFLAGLAANGFDPVGKRCFVVGTGGVGRAIAFALAEGGCRGLVLANRDSTKAERLAADIRAEAAGCDVTVVDPASPECTRDCDLVVNATSLGMAEQDPLPIDPAGLNAAMAVAEVVVNPRMTPLLIAAEARGCRVIPGEEMLKPQPRLFAEFFGLRGDQPQFAGVTGQG